MDSTLTLNAKLRKNFCLKWELSLLICTNVCVYKKKPFLQLLQAPITCLNIVWAVSVLLFFPPFNSPADAVAIKNANYPSGLINIRIITPLEYKQAVMNMGW